MSYLEKLDVTIADFLDPGNMIKIVHIEGRSVSFGISPSLKKRIDQLAKVEGLTSNTIIRKLVDEAQAKQHNCVGNDSAQKG